MMGVNIVDVQPPAALPKGLETVEGVLELLRDRKRYDELVKGLRQAHRQAEAAARKCNAKAGELRKAEQQLAAERQAHEKAAAKREGELDARAAELDARAEALERKDASLKDRETKLRKERADFKAERERQARRLQQALAEAGVST